MTPVNVCNLALAEVGQRVQIASLADQSPAANAASLFFTPKTQMLLRSANWAFARAQSTLTLYKSVLVAGAASTNPPPQPWQYEYLYPSDCQRLRFLQPTLPGANQTTPPLTTTPNSYFSYPPTPTGVPFVEGADFDPNGNPIRVILTNMCLAQAVYTRDLSQMPDLWDTLFLSGVTALLGSYFINALARDKVQMEQQIAIAKNVLDQARAADANESISNTDHIPDWLRARRMTSGAYLWYQGSNGALPGGWDSCQLPNGQFY